MSSLEGTASVEEGCQRYHNVVTDETCESIVSSRQDPTFTLEDFYAANPSIDNACSNLWVDTVVCVKFSNNQETEVEPVDSDAIDDVSEEIVSSDEDGEDEENDLEEENDQASDDSESSDEEEEIEDVDAEDEDNLADTSSANKTIVISTSLREVVTTISTAIEEESDLHTLSITATSRSSQTTAISSD